MKQKEIDTLVQTSWSLVGPWRDDLESTLGPVKYINEFRTISINLPRQVGKTTYLLNMLHRTESMLMFHSRHMQAWAMKNLRQDLHKFIIHADYVTTLKGYRVDNKLSFLLVDEPKLHAQYSVDNVIEELYNKNLLERNFVVIGLGT